MVGVGQVAERIAYAADPAQLGNCEGGDNEYEDDGGREERLEHHGGGNEII